MTTMPLLVTVRPSVAIGPKMNRRGAGFAAAGKSVHITMDGVSLRGPVTSLADWAKTGVTDSQRAAAQKTRMRMTEPFSGEERLRILSDDGYGVFSSALSSAIRFCAGTR